MKRFWSKVEKGDGCWVWIASTNKQGYGQINVWGRPRLAHRVSWRLHNGVVPDGLHVLHKCDNPPCVRPSHLFLGTNLDNIKDRHAKGRTVSGDRCPWTKVPDAEIRRAFRMRAAGSLHREIADDLGVSQGMVSMILSGKRRAGAIEEIADFDS